VDGPVLDALRLGAYQLLRTRIPAHAAVGATVDLVRGEAGSPIAGFVNAVLRRVSDLDEQAWSDRLAPDRTTDPISHLAFVTAHPQWIARSFAVAPGRHRRRTGRRAGRRRPAARRAPGGAPW